MRALWQGSHAQLFGAADPAVGEGGIGAGDAPATRVIFYCGSGWRSSLAWCLARLMGFDDCANYDGGFLEWTMLHPDAESHPVVRGEEGGGGEVAGSR